MDLLKDILRNFWLSAKVMTSRRRFILVAAETGIEDLAQLGAKLDDRYYNNKAYCVSFVCFCF